MSNHNSYLVLSLTPHIRDVTAAFAMINTAETNQQLTHESQFLGNVQISK